MTTPADIGPVSTDDDIDVECELCCRHFPTYDDLCQHLVEDHGIPED